MTIAPFPPAHSYVWDVEHYEDGILCYHPFFIDWLSFQQTWYHPGIMANLMQPVLVLCYVALAYRLELH